MEVVTTEGPDRTRLVQVDASSSLNITSTIRHLIIVHPPALYSHTIGHHNVLSHLALLYHVLTGILKSCMIFLHFNKNWYNYIELNVSYKYFSVLLNVS